MTKTRKDTEAMLRLAAQRIAGRIVPMRGERVLLDTDLAALYGVTTGALNRAVKRNVERFPDDFMFQLTSDETIDLKCQIGISSSAHGGRRRSRPYAFTEQGVAMLSTVLNSKQAIEVNIAIMRAFVRLRQMLETNEELNCKFAVVIKELSIHDKYFRVVFDELRKLTEKPSSPARQIGFKGHT